MIAADVIVSQILILGCLGFLIVTTAEYYSYWKYPAITIRRPILVLFHKWSFFFFTTLSAIIAALDATSCLAYTLALHILLMLSVTGVCIRVSSLFYDLNIPLKLWIYEKLELSTPTSRALSVPEIKQRIKSGQMKHSRIFMLSLVVQFLSLCVPLALFFSLQHDSKLLLQDKNYCSSDLGPYRIAIVILGNLILGWCSFITHRSVKQGIDKTNIRRDILLDSLCFSLVSAVILFMESVDYELGQISAIVCSVVLAVVNVLDTYWCMWVHIKNSLMLYRLKLKFVPINDRASTTQVSPEVNSRFVQEFQLCLQNAEIRKEFESFLKEELSLENYHFYIRSLKFRIEFKHQKPEDLERMKADATALFHEFITVDSLCPVNISGKTRELIVSRFQSSDFTATMFKEAEFEIMSLLCHDSFMRLREKRLKEWKPLLDNLVDTPKTKSDYVL